MRKQFKLKDFILAMLFLISALTGCTGDLKSESNGNSYTHISMNEAIKMMQAEKNYIILDVRTKDEYKAGHIPGAVCVPNETIGEDNIAEFPDKEQIILVYCRSGNRSKQAAAKLSAQGYTNIYEFGGINDWNGEIISDSTAIY